MFKSAQRTARRQKGFTLVELLIVVSLIAIMSGVLIPGFSSYIDSQNVNQATEALKSDLRSVQNRAITGVDSADANTAYWGLKIPSDNAITTVAFKSSTNTTTACTNAVTDYTTEILPGGAVVKNASGVCVFFSLRNGDANIVNSSTGNIIQVGYSDEATCNGVEINSAGLIRRVNLCP